ncbi:hypothetical protein AGMMS49579_04600 [Spirochaetia bacterium]|nr:hypothetical protein AGMMS49579_04600 [Spirochaetia bacterium]
MKKLQVKGLMFVTAVLALGLTFAGCTVTGDYTPKGIDGTWVVDQELATAFTEAADDGGQAVKEWKAVTKWTIDGADYYKFGYTFNGNTFTAWENALSSGKVVQTSSVTGTFTAEESAGIMVVTFTASTGYIWTGTFDAGDLPGAIGNTDGGHNVDRTNTTGGTYFFSNTPAYTKINGDFVAKGSGSGSDTDSLAGGKKSVSHGFAIAKKAVPVGMATSTALPYAIATAEYIFKRGEDPLHK